MDKKDILIASRTLPVFKKVDIVIIGGGPAGFAAAVSSSRQGCKTLLVERSGMFGGMWSLALVNPYFDVKNKGGINEELIQILLKKNAWGGLWDISFDPVEMIISLDKLIIESGVEPLLYTLATDVIVSKNRIEGIVLENKNGASVVIADQVIDCTGDADIAARAGVHFKTGKPKDGLTQPMTMMFKIGGLKKYPVNDTRYWYKKLKEKVTESELLEQIAFNDPALICLPRQGEAMVQWTHLRNFSGLDTEDLTQATLEGRRQVNKGFELMKNNIPGMEDIYLLELPVYIGVRETRRIEGEYTVSLKDIEQGTRHDDGICLVNFPVDIHEPDSNDQLVRATQPYHIPLRSLIPQGIDNLLVAGRPISGCYEAHASYRVTGNCIAMGEAAGIAASVAVKQNTSVKHISSKSIVAELTQKGVKL